MNRAFDDRRAERIGEHLQSAYIAPGKVAGCHVVVAQQGAVVYSCMLGLADREREAPVREDTIWRIHSMTKPVTSVALMMLYERARFDLTDPVHRFIPSWRQVRVLAEDGRLVEPERPPTIRDLLTHTAGLGYGLEAWEPARDHYQEAQVRDGSLTLEELADRIATVPLNFQPGSRWNYSFATDVCARLVEVLSDRPLDDYFREAIFEPLGMVDTGFFVPEAERGRFAAWYEPDPNGGLRAVADRPGRTYLTGPRQLSGGGGLVSTAADYLRFAEMLRRHGELDGARILGRRTLDLMTRNQLQGGASLRQLALVALANKAEWAAGEGFGLGFAVTIDPVAWGAPASPGDYYWFGAANSLFWVDPIEDMIVIFMAQLSPSNGYQFRRELAQLVHQALI